MMSVHCLSIFLLVKWCFDPLNLWLPRSDSSCFKDISSLVSQGNILLDQDNFYLIGLNILITCLLDNIEIS